MLSVQQELQKCRREINLDLLRQFIPESIIEDYKKDHPGHFRERVYGLPHILDGFLLQASESDKSEEHIVNLIYLYHEAQKESIKELELQRRDAYSKEKKKRGRPIKSFVQVQKSKRKSISTNTASFNEAKKRFPIELLERIFQYTATVTDSALEQNHKTWNGLSIKIVDGTLIKTVDNQELRSYFVPKQQENPLRLPLARVVGLIDYYGGYVENFRIDNYNVGELTLLKQMYATIRPGSLLLADALFGSYGHFAYCFHQGTDLLVPGKIGREETIEQTFSTNDFLVRWKRNNAVVWTKEAPASILLRKIEFQNPSSPDTKIVLYTTLLDTKFYPTEAIIALYLCRWDIELSFKEIKIVMQLTHTRGKSVDTVKKEIISHLIVYNILRRTMQDVFAQEGEDFFSLRKAIYEDDSFGSEDTAYIDRLGRSYARKSPGRYPGRDNPIQTKKTRRTT